MTNVAMIKLTDTDSCNCIVKLCIFIGRKSRSCTCNFYLLLATYLFLLGCSTTQPPVPVVDRVKADSVRSARLVESNNLDGQFYIVQQGDTLYGIALKNNIDYKKLAEWNGITDPSSIKLGQKISLSTPISDSQPILFALPQQPIAATIKPDIDSSDFATSAANINIDKLKSSPKALKLPFSEQNVARLQYPTNNNLPSASQSFPVSPAATANTKIEAAPQPESSRSDILASHSVAEWIWPTTGKLLSSFSKNSKGVKISGQAGQPILASAAGEVVYSGHGLRGYGNLIIIKHNNIFLSAYAHNSRLLVKEGDAVASGQKIAEMGNTDTDMIQLHFEIRKHGKPVDPLEYLPNQS
ncbi:peptidoglycan DD-metalloendopeptidase family protein [uncultured Nitrosomonas sp.]|uniref:peptidoglycan DD-metalloendopeptidase family protein n=1 Tax=uncultured Nitrosomonas sp. TaxID=156424 RepID=UPI0025EFF1E1|nr:peptidoglycan DD-metalloendopeptidase family protein [uncultured Nitrosomonas sp.]